MGRCSYLYVLYEIVLYCCTVGLTYWNFAVGLDGQAVIDSGGFMPLLTCVQNHRECRVDGLETIATIAKQGTFFQNFLSSAPRLLELSY